MQQYFSKYIDQKMKNNLQVQKSHYILILQLNEFDNLVETNDRLHYKANRKQL